MRLSSKERLGLAAGVGLLILAIVLIGSRGGWNRFLHSAEPFPVAVSVSAKSVDADNEDRLVSVQGQLVADHPPADAQLGIVAKNAIVLARDVEMYQWQENCIDSVCTQRADWSAVWIDSTRFSEQVGHRNPDRLPLESMQFDGEGIHLEAFQPDINLVISKVGFVPRPIDPTELSSNLAASFSVSDNQLLSGNDPTHPAVGDLRIRYRVVPGGATTLNGVQKSTRLTDPSAIQANK